MLAIVLSRQDIKETDQIVSLYTKEQGRVDLLARGIKKILSKNAAHLEPCSIVEVGIAQGKELQILTNVQTIEFFADIRRDFLKSLYGLWMSGFIKSVFTSPEPDARVFNLIGSWLENLNNEEHISPFLLDAFVLRTLRLLGVSPVIDTCVECQKPLDGKVFFFSPERGGVVGSECIHMVQSGRAVKVEKTTLDMLSFLLQASWKEIRNLGFNTALYIPLHTLLYLFLQYHSEARVEDWKNLAKIS